MWRRIDLDVGEKVKIGGVLVTLEYKSGRRARLHVSTDNDMRIEHIKNENDATTPSKGKTIFGALENSAIIG